MSWDLNDKKEPVMEGRGGGEESMPIARRAGAKVLRLEEAWSILGVRDVVARTSRVRKAGTGGARSHRML